MEKIRGVKRLPEDASYCEMNTPIGNLTIIVSTQGLHTILWDNERGKPAYENILSGLKCSSKDKISREIRKQLDEYFQGIRKNFDIPLVFDGTTFQIKAWRQLLKIPYGTTLSYGEQAQKMGDKKKARAVGMVNGLNPIPIIIPCHRVIGSNGKLVGFGGGLDKKIYLLTLEKNFSLKLHN